MLNLILIASFIFSNFIFISDTDIKKVEFSNENLEISHLSIPFIYNEGELDESVLFYAPLQTGYVYLTDHGLITYDFQFRMEEGIKRTYLLERFLNSAILNISKGEKSPIRINKISKLPNSIQSNRQSAFEDVIFERVYKEIDVRLRASNGGVEKLYYIHPGGDPNEIKISFDGSTSIALNENGDLEVYTEHGEIKFSRPIAFQIIDGTRHEVKVDYSIYQNVYGFVIGDYDKTKELIIDPLIVSTFIGGTGNDGKFQKITKVKVDNEGFIYVVGSTSSPDFPTTLHGIDRTFEGVSDIFIAKFGNDLRRLYACTYIGGSDVDEARDFIFDSEGNIILTGFSGSDDYPVSPDAFQQEYMDGISTEIGVGDVIITKISNDLTTILASTYIGLDGIEFGNAIDIDDEGNIYIAGATSSVDFPMGTGGFRRTKPGIWVGFHFDGFLAKFDNNLTTLLSATYMGSASEDIIETMSVAPNGDVYFAGHTYAWNYVTTEGAFMEIRSNTSSRISEGFISALGPDLTLLRASTFFGGQMDDNILDLKFDSDNNVYITGNTFSDDLPLTDNTFDDRLNGPAEEAFVAKLNFELTELLASTYLGGLQWDCGNELFIDDNNNIYVTGETFSDAFPTSENAFDKVYNGTPVWQGDIFISKFDANLQSLLASTYLGGTYSDGAGSIAIDSDGSVLVAGYSYSPDYPVSENPYNRYLNWGYDVIITKLDSDLSADPTNTDDINKLPDNFILHANYPNPFNPSTNIRFDLPTSEHVSLTVYNLLGEKISTLVSEILPAGIHTVNFDAANLKSGMYIYQIRAGSYIESRKMLLIK